MKNKSLFLNLIFILIFTTVVWAEVPGGRHHVLLDYNWKFILLDTINSENPNFDDTKWRTLNLPHDWSIEGEFKEDAYSNGDGGFLPTGLIGVFIADKNTFAAEEGVCQVECGAAEPPRPRLRSGYTS
jgi:hypothetical protein